jgi:uncharacterized protein YaaR (DUF327 family)
MKNKLFSILLLLVAFSISCSKSDPAPSSVDCAALTKKVSDTGLAYVSSQTSQTCKAYVAALNDFVNNASKCGASAADIADAKADIAAITCP